MGLEGVKVKRAETVGPLTRTTRQSETKEKCGGGARERAL